MNGIILDTSDLVSALDALIVPKPQWTSDADPFGALLLCEYLMLGYKVGYDADVRTKTEHRIEQLFNQARESFGSEAADKLYDRILGIYIKKIDEHPDVSEESIVRDSIDEATAAFAKLPAGSLTRQVLLEHPYGLTDPEKYILEPLQSKKPFKSDRLQELWHEKHITGRRFYVALHTNEAAFERMARIQKTLTEEELQVLFSIFRAQFSENRAAYAAQYVTNFPDTAFYQPTGTRMLLMEQVPELLRQHHCDEWQDILEPELRSLWISSEGVVGGDRIITIPLIMHSELKKSPNKISFLRSVLEFPSTERYKELQSAIACYATASDKERENIIEALRSRVEAWQRGKHPLLLEVPAVFTSVAQSLIAETIMKAFLPSGQPEKDAVQVILRSILDGVIQLGRSVKKLFGRSARAGTILSKEYKHTLHSDELRAEVERIFQ